MHVSHTSILLGTDSVSLLVIVSRILSDIGIKEYYAPSFRSQCSTSIPGDSLASFDTTPPTLWYDKSSAFRSSGLDLGVILENSHPNSQFMDTLFVAPTLVRPSPLPPILGLAYPTSSHPLLLILNYWKSSYRFQRRCL